MPNISVKKLFIVSGVLAALLAAVLGFLFYSSSSKDFIENNTGAVVIPTIHLSKTEKLEYTYNNKLLIEMEKNV